MATRLMPASRLYPGRMPVAADLQRGRDATVAEVDHCRLYTPGRLPQEVHLLGCLRAEVARAPRACLPTAQASSQPTGGAEGAGLA